jgi:hypothetical protein
MFGSRISHLGKLRCRARVSFAFPSERRGEPRDGADPPLPQMARTRLLRLIGARTKKPPEGALFNANQVRSDEER